MLSQSGMYKVSCLTPLSLHGFLKVPFWPSCWAWLVFPWRNVSTCIGDLAPRCFVRTRWSAPWRWAGITPTTALRRGKPYYGRESNNNTQCASVKILRWMRELNCKLRKHKPIEKTRANWNTCAAKSHNICTSALAECSDLSCFREKLGNEVLIKTARDELSPKVRTQSPQQFIIWSQLIQLDQWLQAPLFNTGCCCYLLKVSAVSAVVNWGTSPKAFVFRNYNHTPGSLSRYAGGSGYQMWEAVRASSAAPGYFQEFTLHSDIHQVGNTTKSRMSKDNKTSCVVYIQTLMCEIKQNPKE